MLAQPNILMISRTLLFAINNIPVQLDREVDMTVCLHLEQPTLLGAETGQVRHSQTFKATTLK